MKLKRVTSIDGLPYGWDHWCPGCRQPHVISVEQPNSNGARWTFDGNVDAPTFTPSIHCHIEKTDGTRVTTCHYFIRGGAIEFCGDSPHALAGQTVPLPDLPPEWFPQPKKEKHMSKAKAKAKAAPKKSASKARKATAPKASAPQAAAPAEQPSNEAAVEVKPGVTREGHVTTRTHADGGQSVIHHANEDAAREYEASVPQEAV